jgi:hypothetical protein
VCGGRESARRWAPPATALVTIVLFPMLDLLRCR